MRAHSQWREIQASPGAARGCAGLCWPALLLSRCCGTCTCAFTIFILENCPVLPPDRHTQNNRFVRRPRVVAARTHHAVGHTPPPAPLRMTRLWFAALAVSGCAISISVRDRAAALTDHTRAAPGAWRATSFPPEHSTYNTPSTHGGKNGHGRELDAAHCGGDGNALIVSFPGTLLAAFFSWVFLSVWSAGAHHPRVEPQHDSTPALRARPLCTRLCTARHSPHDPPCRLLRRKGCMVLLPGRYDTVLYAAQYPAAADADHLL